jgi:hypothetical protein
MQHKWGMEEYNELCPVNKRSRLVRKKGIWKLKGIRRGIEKMNVAPMCERRRC